jgi:hypothetical protein
MLTLLPFQLDPITGAYSGGQMIPLGTPAAAPAGTPLVRVVPFAGAAAAAAAAPTPTPAVLVPQGAPDPERDAAERFVQDAAGGVIKRLHEFLQTNFKQFAPLSDTIPLVQRAAELYEAGDYPRAYTQAYHAYRSIGLVRARYPDVPTT